MRRHPEDFRRWSRRRRMLGCLAGWVALGLPHVARAQLVRQYFPTDIPGYSPDFSASVVARQQDQDLPQGIEIDSFIIKPQVTEGYGYNSNTLGVPGSGSEEVSSSGALRIQSDWGRNALAASISATDQRYLDLPVASFTNYTAALGGAVTLGSDTASIAYSHLGLHLAATDLGVFDVITPVPYSVDDARLGYTTLKGRFSFDPSFEFENFSFGQSGGAENINYDSLSHREEIGTLTTRYELSTGNAAVVVIRGTGAQFDAPAGTSGDNYTDVAGFVGLDFRGDSLVQYRALVGVETRRFAASGTATATTPTFELDAVWTPTRLDTVTATLTRRFDDPESPFARDQTITDARLQYDHELRRTVFLRGYAEFGKSSSPGTPGIDLGTDDQTQLHFGASATWNVNRYLKTTLSYGYTNSASSGSLDGLYAALADDRTTFTSNSILLSVTVSE